MSEHQPQGSPNEPCFTYVVAQQRQVLTASASLSALLFNTATKMTCFKAFTLRKHEAEALQEC